MSEIPINPIQIGPPVPVPEEPPKLHSAFVPFLLILIVLNFSAARECLSVYHHRAVLEDSNADARKHLEKTSQKAEFVEKLRLGLVKLSETDPVAGRIRAEYFPAPLPPAKPEAPPLAPAMKKDLPPLAPPVKKDLPPMAPPAPKQDLGPLAPRMPDPVALPTTNSVPKSH